MGTSPIFPLIWVAALLKKKNGQVEQPLNQSLFSGKLGGKINKLITEIIQHESDPKKKIFYRILFHFTQCTSVYRQI